MRRAALLLVFATGGCLSTPPAPGHEPTFGCTASKVLFPLNVAPDVASNAFCYFASPVMLDDPGNLVGIVVLFAPVIGLITGVHDAWEGYPFWDPVALDEHRVYRTCAGAPARSKDAPRSDTPSVVIAQVDTNSPSR